MNNIDRIKEVFNQSIKIKKAILADEIFIERIANVSDIIIDAYRNGNKVLFAGNGGSAADAQHLAAELTGKFYLNREPLSAEALHTNSSFVTAVANDFGYDEIYLRGIKAQAKKGDVFIAISTSGNSVNLIKAMEYCNDNDIITVGFTGASGGKMKNYSDYLLNVPSTDTPRIQEIHIVIGHIICELVEHALFAHDCR
ncbi:MAG: D-sedoheptulose 7-phosphate isomerase [Bacteroidales bacterium]|jgi:D-sedoheptulose 7-phosphate isomerase|nr:D-sedoheptulose 7-phosphate isomerase [Bacteroidales bacterium]MDD2204584.1 D-sedoheptulose 7-phosphate isomerase [Bacteroidales bacterium]MDD3152337.1 D-sedoheptulose 7-phosphate isomerase [Bacteroidales bacterium]MDD3914385.1 D-sedoheptulose 7-phosphate isomerase [Bacteroidales bacterium]MDD4633479.1 D-sedoheptulose 7-phosphate isomerase [Bacteroidales bacterium]